MAPDRTSPTAPSRPDDDALEAIVAEFLLEREEGRKPSIDDYLARYPKHAEALAQLLTYDTHPPARRDSTRSRGGAGAAEPTRPATASAPTPGRIGPYDLIDHVSTAGGGTVYRARHRDAGHVVALKVLDTRGAVDPRDIERFKREAAMLRAMNLVDVVTVLETGEDAGRFWIAMKWLEGDTFSKLREAAREKSHPLHDGRERARLVARVARTFAAIHGYGILHRDVKPSNLMIDRTGEPMIIDFGIAQAPDLPELTATTDQIMGTPRYLAPELLAGGNREVSPRTDVYGLGLCLYELCTGVEAFKQSMRADLFTAIRTTGPLPPRRANPAVSDDLSAVILRSLEIDPARRYTDMTSFAEDLDRVARGESPHPTTLRGANPLLRAIRRNKKRLIAAACLAAVLVPAIWLVTKRGLDEIRARDLEAQLRPFAFFSPEAFAGGVGVPASSVAGELADNPAVTSKQRLLAAWIPLLTGDVNCARAHLGTVPLSDDTFATTVLREHLNALRIVQQGGHAAGTFLDAANSRPAVNPVTGHAYEVLLPVDNPEGVVTRDPSQFDASVRAISQVTPPSTPEDHLVLATLHWSLLPNDARVDSSSRRATIEDELRHALDSEATRIPALHVRGAMRFQAGDFVGARADLENVVAAQRDALGSRYLLGIACTRSGDPRLACRHLEIVERDLPRSHLGRFKMLAQMALARAAAGEVDRAVELCHRWWTDPGPESKWQDVVIPRVLAAHIRRDHGDKGGAKALLEAAIEEEERFKLAKREREERGSPTPSAIALWKPAFVELIRLAEELHDDELAEDYRQKMNHFLMKPLPVSAEAYIEQDLAGLRPIDPKRALSPLDQSLPKNQ